MRKEMGVHGQRWASIFDGYFSDPEAARPLVEVVERAIEASRPAVAAGPGRGHGLRPGGAAPARPERSSPGERGPLIKISINQAR